jgi:hypothetical protein
MASASITVRKTKAGTSYAVRYRLGGRAYPIVHGGSFRTLREARIRRDLIAGELAAGRNPADALRVMLETPARRTLAEWAEQYRRSRIDLADETTKSLGSHLRRILPVFGEREPEAISWADVQEWVATMAVELKPGSVSKYVTTLRQLLDFAGVDPNPARDKRVKLPALVVEEPQPPTAKQFLAMLDAVPCRWLLPLITIEQTAMAVGETAAIAWGDVDPGREPFPPAPENRQGCDRHSRPLGAGARVANGDHRGNLPAGRPHRRAAGVSRLHAGRGQERDGQGLQGRRDPSLPPARPAAPQDHDLAPRRRTRPGAGRACRPLAAEHEPRRLQPCPPAR